MMERTIEVTEDHIEEGLRNQKERRVILEPRCPIQLALKKSYDGFPSVRVHRSQTYLLRDGQHEWDDGVTVLYHMPDVWKWIWYFDYGKETKPIKLKVEKYQGVLRMVIAKEV